MEKNEEKKKSPSVWKKVAKVVGVAASVGVAAYFIDKKFYKGRASSFSDDVDNVTGKAKGMIKDVFFKENIPNGNLVCDFTESESSYEGVPDLQDLDSKIDMSSDANPVEEDLNSNKGFEQKQGYTQGWSKRMKQATLEARKNCYRNGSGEAKRSYASDYLGKRSFL